MDYTRRVVDHWLYTPVDKSETRRLKLVKLECKHILGPVLWELKLKRMWCFWCERPDLKLPPRKEA